MLYNNYIVEWKLQLTIVIVFAEEER